MSAADRLNKKRKLSLLTKSHGGPTCAAAILSDHAILKPLVESRFLTCAELGRLLLLTSKEVTAAMEADSNDDGKTGRATQQEPNTASQIGKTMIWKALCCHYWGDEALVENIVKSTGVSPERLFRNLSLSHSRNSWQNGVEVPRLKYDPSAYVIIVEVRQWTDNKILLVKSVPGETVPEFFSMGNASIPITPTVDIGVPLDLVQIERTLQTYRTTDWYRVDNDSPEGRRVLSQWIESKWNAKVHLMRKQPNGKQQFLQLSHTVHSRDLVAVFIADARGKIKVEKARSQGFWAVQPWRLNAKMMHQFAKALHQMVSFAVHVSFEYGVNYTCGTKPVVGITGLSIASDITAGDQNLRHIIEQTDFQLAHFIEAVDEWDENKED